MATVLDLAAVLRDWPFRPGAVLALARQPVRDVRGGTMSIRRQGLPGSTSDRSTDELVRRDRVGETLVEIEGGHGREPDHRREAAQEGRDRPAAGGEPADAAARASGSPSDRDGTRRREANAEAGRRNPGRAARSRRNRDRAHRRGRAVEHPDPRQAHLDPHAQRAVGTPLGLDDGLCLLAGGPAQSASPAWR